MKEILFLTVDILLINIAHPRCRLIGGDNNVTVYVTLRYDKIIQIDLYSSSQYVFSAACNKQKKIDSLFLNLFINGNKHFIFCNPIRFSGLGLLLLTLLTISSTTEAAAKTKSMKNGQSVKTWLRSLRAKRLVNHNSIDLTI